MPWDFKRVSIANLPRYEVSFLPFEVYSGNVIYVCNWRGTMNQEELRLHRCCFTGHRICNFYNRYGDGNGYMGSGDCVGEKENEQGLASYMCFATSEF